MLLFYERLSTRAHWLREHLTQQLQNCRYSGKSLSTEKVVDNLLHDNLAAVGQIHRARLPFDELALLVAEAGGEEVTPCGQDVNVGHYFPILENYLDII